MHIDESKKNKIGGKFVEALARLDREDKKEHLCVRRRAQASSKAREESDRLLGGNGGAGC